jgi:hypothetical protein
MEAVDASIRFIHTRAVGDVIATIVYASGLGDTGKIPSGTLKCTE